MCLLFATAQLMAQSTHRTCGTLEHNEVLKAKDLKYADRLIQSEKQISDFIASHPNLRTSGGSLTIPVVFHLVYQNATENISDAQLLTQLDVLNEDFQRLNADTTNTPSAFQGVAGGMSISFCMAQVDPSGNATNGIERRQTTVGSFSTNDNVKFYSSGGLDSWDTENYFNIWVCDLGNFLLGYGEFPNGTTSNTYGLVIHYAYTGRDGSAQSPYDKGRTATHEVGHCFGLAHIWGDDGTACSGSDNVADTPNQADETYGCPAFPQVSCSNGPNGDMFMNYMDYTDDACMNLFTVGQCTRMITAINLYYPTLFTSTACQTSTTFADDASATSVIDPNGVECNSSLAPVVRIKNLGTNNLTSVTINSKVDNGAVATYAWSGNLAQNATADVTLPAITLSNGSHTFTAYTTNPNGLSDPNAVNDTSTSTFSYGVGGAAPYTQGFESGIPSNVAIVNSDGDVTWELTTAAASLGSNSVWIDNFSYNSVGQRDDMVLPSTDLTSLSTPTLTFDVAYQFYVSGATTYVDSMEVSVSTDCGTTWNQIYYKGGSDLETTPATANAFTPTSGQWRNEIISLSGFASATSAIIRFTGINGYGNNLYIDNINITNAAGLNETYFNNVSLYPNPATELLTVQLPAGLNHATLNLNNALGQTLQSIQAVSGKNNINLQSLSKGIYFVEVVAADNSKSTFKFVKE